MRALLLPALLAASCQSVPVPTAARESCQLANARISYEQAKEEYYASAERSMPSPLLVVTIYAKEGSLDLHRSIIAESGLIPERDESGKVQATKVGSCTYAGKLHTIYFDVVPAQNSQAGQESVR